MAKKIYEDRGGVLQKGIYTNDTIHGLVALSEYEKRIISSIGFNRLHDVYQNSTVYLTFPTNRTKRFEHSIGTMKLCSDMFFHSILNAPDEMLSKMCNMFLDELENIVKGIAKNSSFCEQKLGGRTPDAMPRVKFDKFRNSLIPNNINKEYQVVYLILIQSIRAAALLHDIGHPPFSHIVEYALKAVYQQYKSDNASNNSRIQNFVDVLSKYFEGNKKLHEQMGDEISDSILREVIIPIAEEDERYDENLFEALVLECVRRIFANKGNFQALHRIIDSSLDGDRLDYVTRDCINSGMNSGKIDYNRIINDMQLVVDEDDIFFCIPLKAVNSVEDFIKRRFNIYKDIIYHHRVIKTDYLLEYAVRDLIIKYLNEGSVKRVDNNKIVIPFDISGLWFPLGDTTTVEKANALSQWNDSWLMTILKQIYYTEYYQSRIEKGTPEFILSQRLSELLRNKKCYYSLIKRGENFKIIDDAIKHALAQNKNDIQELVSKVNVLSNQSKLVAPPNGTTVDMKGTLDFIDEILKTTSKSSKGFAMAFIARRYKAIGIASLEALVRDIVITETNKEFTNKKLYDIIVVFKSISIGLDDPIYFYNYNGEICTLDEISGISDILRLDSDYLPVFYIYILLKDEDSIIKEKRDILLREIGEKIGQNLSEIILSILKERIHQMEEPICAK